MRTDGVYIGIGSNLGDPLAQVHTAIRTLARLPDSRILAVSQPYRTAPVGPQDQPDFINAVVRIETGLAPWALLQALQAIERAQGRVPSVRRWGPRILDLDILLYGDRCIRQPRLRIPHGELVRRAFALIPLAEIAPSDLSIPGWGPLNRLSSACSREGIEPLGAVLEKDPCPIP